MGWWFDRSGIGPLILLGAIMISVASFLVAGMSTKWEFYAAYGLLFGFLGQATLFSPLMANIVNLFERNRGFAAGVVASGQAFAGTVWPPVIRYLNEAIGWRETYFYFGVFTLCTMVPLSFVFLFQDRFIHRANVSVTRPVTTDGGDDAASDPMRTGGVPPIYWMITLSIGIVGCCMAMALPLAHIVFISQISGTQLRVLPRCWRSRYSSQVSRASRSWVISPIVLVAYRPSCCFL